MAVAMGLLAAASIEQFTQTICLQINEDTLLSNPTGQAEQTLLFLTPDQCRHSTIVQKRVAHLNLLLSVIMGIACVITTPFWGTFSDKVGRKICINLNTLSFVLGDLILVLVLTFPNQISYWWILLNPLIEGLFGGLGGGQTILGAYVCILMPSVSPIKMHVI
jgi:MFS family permease